MATCCMQYAGSDQRSTKKEPSLWQRTPKGRKKPQKKINTELSFSDTPVYLPAMGSVDFPNGKLYWHHSSDGVFARILSNLFLNSSKFWLPQNTHNNEFQFRCALSENHSSLLVINQMISLCEMWKVKQVKTLASLWKTMSNLYISSSPHN